MAILKKELIKRQSVSPRKVDNEIIIYDSESNYVYHLNKTAAVIFEYCGGGNNIDKIIDMYSKRFNISTDIANKDVKECIETLLKRGLIFYENGANKEPSEIS